MTPTRSSPNHWLQLDNQLCFAMYSASLAITKLYRPLLAELGLTYPQYIVMLSLWEHDDQSVSDLGRRLSLDSGTLTPLLKRLQASGLITRNRDSADERRVRVTTTAAGRQLKTQALRVPQCMLQASQCSLPELEQLTHQVQQLRDQLAAYTAESPPQ